MGIIVLNLKLISGKGINIRPGWYISDYSATVFEEQIIPCFTFFFTTFLFFSATSCSYF